MNNAQLILQDSGNVEYYTDPKIIESSREVMGSIDLDPASSVIANQWVKAGKIFTIEDDGLSQQWFGNVFLNHPFSREGNPKWIKKLVSEFDSGNVKQACCICYAATSESWFKPLHFFPQCYLIPRTNYYLPDGKKKQGVTKGSVVTYLGPEREKFYKIFGRLGEVKVRR